MVYGYFKMFLVYDILPFDLFVFEKPFHNLYGSYGY